MTEGALLSRIVVLTFSVKSFAVFLSIIACTQLCTPASTKQGRGPMSFPS